MARMMAMLQSNVAWYAEIVILAGSACDKVGLLEDYERQEGFQYKEDITLTSNARVAGAAEIERLARLFFLQLRCERARNLFLCFDLESLLGSDGLGCAGNDLAIFHESLDQEVVLTFTKVALLNTLSTEIEVPDVADATMPVDVWNGFIALVAADSEGCAWNWEASTSCYATHGVQPFGENGMLSEEVVTMSRESGHMCLIVGTLINEVFFLRGILLGHISLLKGSFASIRETAFFRDGPAVRLLCLLSSFLDHLTWLLRVGLEGWHEGNSGGVICQLLDCWKGFACAGLGLIFGRIRDVGVDVAAGGETLRKGRSWLWHLDRLGC